MTLGCIITFESLYLLALAGSLVSEGLRFVFSFSLRNHSVLSFNVLLLLKLLEELFVSDEDAVGISLFLCLSWEQFRGWVPSKRLTRLHSRVEWLQTSALRSLLLTKLIRSVAKHDTLVVSNASFGPVTTAYVASSHAAVALIDICS